jgi:hypothetical protein
MTRLGLALTLLGILVVFSATANAQKDRFTGSFVSTDPNTRGVTRVVISDDQIHIWGRCHPTDCDWGTIKVETYAPSVDADKLTTARAMSAYYEKGFATTIVIITPLAQNRLKVETFTKFRDRSGRSDYTSKEIMVREDMGLNP